MDCEGKLLAALGEKTSSAATSKSPLVTAHTKTTAGIKSPSAVSPAAAAAAGAGGCPGEGDGNRTHFNTAQDSPSEEPDHAEVPKKHPCKTRFPEPSEGPPARPADRASDPGAPHGVDWHQHQIDPNNAKAIVDAATGLIGP